VRKPLCIDLFCGLGGWTDGFLAEGWECIGFDIERHDYGTGGYPGQLVIQDALTIHGSQFRNADCIVASPPCQEFSYMAMPWSRAKQIAAALRGNGEFPDGYTGSRTVADLTALFDTCFRIQREACEAAGRYIPMVVENVRGAQPWVGPARAHFGSFYFWGNINQVGGRVVAGEPRLGAGVRAAKRGRKVDGFNFHQHENGQPGGSFQTAAVKTIGHADIRDGYTHTRHLTNQRESDAIKHGGDCFNDPAWPGKQGGVKQHGSGAEWFDEGICKHSSRSDSRKAASAAIAKIPFPLAQHVARCFKP
jgi:hypothetical protein